MRKKIVLIIVCLFLILSTKGKVYANEYIVNDVSMILYTATSTPVYAEPLIDIQPLIMVGGGLPFQVTGITSNGWFRVVTDNIYYIPGGYLIGAEGTVTEPIPSVLQIPQKEYREAVNVTVNNAEELKKVIEDAIQSNARQINIVSNENIFKNIISILEAGTQTSICNYENYGAVEYEVHQEGSNYTIAVKKDATLQEEKMVDAYVLQELPKYNRGTDFEKIKAVHDFVCNHVEYCYETLENLNASVDSGRELNTTAFDAIVNKKAVCSGYAMLFQKFMDEMGIPCYIARGNAGNGPHAWNLVNIEDQWYHIDCTYDDQGSYITDKWFLVGSAETGYSSWGGIPIAQGRYYR